MHIDRSVLVLGGAGLVGAQVVREIARELEPERIIVASSNPGDVVADFFCGSGTTLVVARRMGRRILGCDVNEQAVAITRARLGAITASA